LEAAVEGVRELIEVDAVRDVHLLRSAERGGDVRME
jgi:hypothetical protein